MDKYEYNLKHILFVKADDDIDVSTLPKYAKKKTNKNDIEAEISVEENQIYTGDVFEMKSHACYKDKIIEEVGF